MEYIKAINIPLGTIKKDSITLDIDWDSCDIEFKGLLVSAFVYVDARYERASENGGSSFTWVKLTKEQLLRNTEVALQFEVRILYL